MQLHLLRPGDEKQKKKHIMLFFVKKFASNSLFIIRMTYKTHRNSRVRQRMMENADENTLFHSGLAKVQCTQQFGDDVSASG